MEPMIPKLTGQNSDDRTTASITTVPFSSLTNELGDESMRHATVASFACGTSDNGIYSNVDESPNQIYANESDDKTLNSAYQSHKSIKDNRYLRQRYDVHHKLQDKHQVSNSQSRYRHSNNNNELSSYVVNDPVYSSTSADDTTTIQEEPQNSSSPKQILPRFVTSWLNKTCSNLVASPHEIHIQDRMSSRDPDYSSMIRQPAYGGNKPHNNETSYPILHSNAANNSYDARCQSSVYQDLIGFPSSQQTKISGINKQRQINLIYNDRKAKTTTLPIIEPATSIQSGINMARHCDSIAAHPISRTHAQTSRPIHPFMGETSRCHPLKFDRPSISPSRLYASRIFSYILPNLHNCLWLYATILLSVLCLYVVLVLHSQGLLHLLASLPNYSRSPRDRAFQELECLRLAHYDTVRHSLNAPSNIQPVSNQPYSSFLANTIVGSSATTRLSSNINPLSIMQTSSALDNAPYLTAKISERLLFDLEAQASQQIFLEVPSMTKVDIRLEASLDDSSPAVSNLINMIVMGKLDQQSFTTSESDIILLVTASNQKLSHRPTSYKILASSEKLLMPRDQLFISSLPNLSLSGRWWFLVINDNRYPIKASIVISPSISDTIPNSDMISLSNTGTSSSNSSSQSCQLDCPLDDKRCQNSCVACKNLGLSGCEPKDCDTKCYLHGQCVDGICYCSRGWSGPSCETKMCPNDCSGNGECVPRDSLDSHPGFGGNSSYGFAYNGFKAPRGQKSQLVLFRTREKDGTYRYVAHEASDTSRAAKSAISMKARLDNSDLLIVYGNHVKWVCACKNNRISPDCSKERELNCDDSKDNDNDGLTDCEDSDCCSSRECKENLMCVESPDPINIIKSRAKDGENLARLDFFDRVKFLVDDSSVQSYAHHDAYDRIRASVIRGRILEPGSNEGLIGVRVSVADHPQFGFTLSRSDGWFDILVNGGDPVVLQFHRVPFPPARSMPIEVEANTIAIMPPITMSLTHNKLATKSKLDLSEYSTQCNSNDELRILPSIVNHKQEENQVGLDLYEGILRDKVTLTGSNVNLVYLSSFNHYMTLIKVRLIKELPENSSLAHVHVKVMIAGMLHEDIVAPQSHLMYIFAWNRLDAYNQRVFGTIEAKLTIGYEYSNCDQIVWTQLVILARGYDLIDASAVPNWNVDVHHRFDPESNVLQLGSGEQIPFNYFHPPVVEQFFTSLLSAGDYQDGTVHRQNVHGMISGPNSSLLLVQNGKIVQLDSHGQTVRTLEIGKLEMKSRNTLQHSDYYPSPSDESSNRPHGMLYILHDSAEGCIYAADTRLAKIIQIQLSQFSVKLASSSNDTLSDQLSQVTRELSHHHQHHRQTEADSLELRDYKVIAGGGSLEYELSNGNFKQEQQIKATSARLIDPKSMALNYEQDLLYFADGSFISAIHLATYSIIPVIKGEDLQRARRKRASAKQDIALEARIPCRFGQSLPLDIVTLRWPDHLVFDSVTKSLYFTDRDAIFSLMPDARLQLINGLPNEYCSDDGNLFKFGTITAMQQFKFMKGSLIVAYHTKSDDTYQKLTSHLGVVQVTTGDRFNLDEASTWTQRMLSLKSMQFQGPYKDNIMSTVTRKPLNNLIDWRASSNSHAQSLIFQRHFGLITSLLSTSDGRLFALEKSDRNYTVYILQNFNPAQLHKHKRLHLVARDQTELDLSESDNNGQTFSILNPISDEIYTFSLNNYHHQSTRSALDGTVVAHFTYYPVISMDETQEQSKMILSSIVDSNMNEIKFARNRNSKQGQQSSLVNYQTTIETNYGSSSRIMVDQHDSMVYIDHNWLGQCHVFRYSNHTRALVGHLRTSQNIQLVDRINELIADFTNYGKGPFNSTIDTFIYDEFGHVSERFK
ncbi:Teneurin-a [Fragariocoptes setiger]|uniref:Teneurin-a n=1 Tax=Fragariocoptes setiger TaxID=1670756 RepID=A0ABQ7SBI3_9ACAR|nr:Teneurin-a [Fragariocoptes setiger]